MLRGIVIQATLLFCTAIKQLGYGKTRGAC